MAVPSSGELRILGIFSEINENDYSALNQDGTNNISLTGLSTGTFGTINTTNASADRPDGSTPHAMSEFYAYDHDLTTLTSFSSTSNQISCANACAASATITRYHDGTGTNPVVGDLVYTDSAGTSALGNGFYKHGGNICFKVDNGTGEVTQTQGCRSERHLKKNIKFIGNSENGIPMYHFEYKDVNHTPSGPGTYVGTMVDDLQRLGYHDVIIDCDGVIFVDYSQIDVDCKLLN